MPGHHTERPFSRRIRLPSAAYGDRAATFHLTIRAFVEHIPFKGSVGDAVWRVILDRHPGGGAVLHAACLMPDHLHLLASPGAEPLDRWIGTFKSFTTRAAWEAGHTGRLWQPSFHDRRVRDETEAVEVMAYIRNNPVMAGFVEEPEKWPWLGVWAT